MAEENKQELTGKEAYEAQKAQREQKRQKKQRKDTTSRMTRKIVLTAVILIVIALGIYGLFLLAQKSGPQGEDFSRAIEIMESSGHIATDAVLPEYTSNPPTSGPHYADPAHTGFRGDEDIADGHFIHTMEHGNIWISYQPDVSEQIIEELKDFAGNRVVVSQRGANETDIALAAWGRLDTFDVDEELTEADKQRIHDFIARYTDKAPEQLPPTAHSQGI